MPRMFFLGRRSVLDIRARVIGVRPVDPRHDWPHRRRLDLDQNRIGEGRRCQHEP
jgi:hypothetical protein